MFFLHFVSTIANMVPLDWTKWSTEIKIEKKKKKKKKKKTLIEISAASGSISK